MEVTAPRGPFAKEGCKRGPAIALFFVVILCAATKPATGASPEGKFKRLSAAEIRARVVGRIVTDQSHWSDRFEPGGVLRATDLGVPKPGTWHLSGNEMCVVRKAKVLATECFEIWIRNDEIEYRRDGVTLATGVLRNE